MKNPIAVLRYLLLVHILALIILAVFQLAPYLSNNQYIINMEGKYGYIHTAMLKGIQFDNIITQHPPCFTVLSTVPHFPHDAYVETYPPAVLLLPYTFHPTKINRVPV